VNTLKWSTLIGCWPFKNQNNRLELCIDITTNGHGWSSPNGHDSVFQMGSFFFDVGHDARCVNKTNPTIFTTFSPQVVTKMRNHHHRKTCFIYPYCDGNIQHDPVVYAPSDLPHGGHYGHHHAETVNKNGMGDQNGNAPNKSKVAESNSRISLVDFIVAGIISFLILTVILGVCFAYRRRKRQSESVNLQRNVEMTVYETTNEGKKDVETTV